VKTSSSVPTAVAVSPHVGSVMEIMIAVICLMKETAVSVSNELPTVTVCCTGLV